MSTRLSALPNTITAGDTVAVTLTLADYPAPTWTVAWSLAGASVVSADYAANGSDHDLDLSAIQTAALSAGTYQHRLRVTDGTTVKTLAQPALIVVGDIGAAGEGDMVSFYARTIPVLQAALTGTLEGEMKMYMIGGRQVMTFTPKELQQMLDTYEARLSVLQGTGFGVAIRYNYRGSVRC